MARRPSRLELDEFLSELHTVRARDEKAAASRYIEVNRKHLDRFIEEKRRQGNRKQVQYYRDLIEKYEPRQKGMFFDETVPALKSFALSSLTKDSFTIPTDHGWNRRAATLAAAVILGFTIYLGFKAREYAFHVVEGMEARIENEGLNAGDGQDQP
ncbi:MAG: hypothetical protein ACYTGH_21110 [Planctomycetota bacterium]|jgi:hypothetical protein